MNRELSMSELRGASGLAEDVSYDAILVVGFGGPERGEDVMPFLENVTRGRNVPRERLEEVAKHYDHFGGRSPINDHVRDLIAALGPELKRHGVMTPVYWGNRNWHPFLADTLKEMEAAGVRRALAVVLAAYSSYSSCRQYREDIERAREETGAGAPDVDKVRVFYNHPEFVAANADRVREAMAKIEAAARPAFHVTFTAHSIPESMARTSRYEAQLLETCRLVAEEIGVPREGWSLVYQSRSGRPQDPWLGPDILDHLRDLKGRGTAGVIVHPIGFLSDHMEVLYDLDEEARLLCEEIGLPMVRSRTVGTHRGFVRMLRELICERLAGARSEERRSLGQFGPSHDVCPLDCCLPPQRPARAHAAT
ncbi:Ferrochelatase [Aquisphaera giovannonii]|uniref:Ferrochelatase n=1 Tax=Aquisphaera giovannonii TaxID=406548 RepID=A0A5B9VZP3_9BACT|nr:ferrochelatase [Aquisphaera giovannonii]QEH33150.1 Ferrochelatase [Aquisphaera giovannonii]